MTTPTAARDVPRPGADSNAKRAAKVADLIVEDVMALGWPVGEVLGSEAELLERYHVSRAVFREAVRLVEHQQVARTRRGPGDRSTHPSPPDFRLEPSRHKGHVESDARTVSVTQPRRRLVCAGRGRIARVDAFAVRAAS